MKITSNILREQCDINVKNEVVFNGIHNLSFSGHQNFLSWLVDDTYLHELESNTNITGVLTTADISKKILRKDLHVFICLDVMSEAIKLLNYIAVNEGQSFKSIISESAKISEFAYVEKENVIIGNNVVIEPFASIMKDVVIHDNVIIRSGARLGADNFDRHITKQGEVIRLISNNKVILNSGCEIGTNVIIDKGDSGIDTIVGENTMIHDGTQICHGVQIGKRNHIWGGVFFCGHCSTGDDVRIQPKTIISNNVKIGNNCYIGINSVVSANLEEGSTYLGYRNLQSKGTISALKDKFSKLKNSVDETR